MAEGVLGQAVGGRVWPARDAEFGVSWETVTLLVLNLLDGLFTLTFLQLEVAEELNPLMRVAYEGSPLSFMALKLGVVHLGVWVLCIHRELKVVHRALVAGACLYAGIVLYHLAFLAVLLLR